MNGYDSSEDHQPVTWFRGYPIYSVYLIVIGFVVSMVATTFLIRFNGQTLLDWLTFTSEEVYRGQIWRIFTYGLVNPPSRQFVVHMFVIGWCGRDLERFFGRRKFFTLYGCLYLLTPLFFTLIGKWWTLPLAGETGALALFVAFATVYPGVAVYFGILAKWLAVVLVGIFTLIYIAYHEDAALISLLATTAFAYVFVRYERGHFSLPRFNFFRRKPKLRVLPDLAPSRSPRLSAEKEPAMAEVDTLLDKIARSGIGSLTAKERARLDAAGAELTKRRR